MTDTQCELQHNGIVAAIISDAPILKLVLIGDTTGKDKILLDADQLRWLIKDAGPELLDQLGDPLKSI